MSETMNPYAAPKAAVADVFNEEGRVQPVKIFSTKGRVGRLRYLAYSFLGYLALVIAILVNTVAAARGNSGITVWTAVLMGITCIAYLILIAMLTIQRSHDMDWSGWSALAAFIPFAGLIWIFKSGTVGNNRFGAPPPPNTLLVKIGALMFPGIMVIGIIAAVALPAYQDYVKRAKTAQIVKP